MNNSLVIKNLAIALEALARIGGSWSQIELFDGVTKLLKTEIKLAEEDNNTPKPPPPPVPHNSDDIPF